MKKILVTGGTGHIGNNLCRALAEKEENKIKCLLRKNSDTSSLGGIDYEKAFGDILDRESFLEAAGDCDYIIHLAAIFSHNPNLEKKIIETAVNGTKNLIHVCRNSGVKKVIYTSSVAALGVSDTSDALVTETDLVSGECEAYTRAKLESQVLFEDAMRKGKLPGVIVLPSSVIGENDFRTTPSNHMILRFIKQPNFFYIEGGINVVHISDVVNGHIKALEKGRVGEKYILGGTNVTVLDLMKKVAKLTGRKKPFLKLGQSVVYPLAVMFDILARLTDIRAPISRMQAKTRIGKFGFYSIEKARRELDYSPLSLDESLKRTVAWFKSRNLI